VLQEQKTKNQTSSTLEQLNTAQVKKLLKKLMSVSGVSSRISYLYNGILKVYHHQFIPVAVVTATKENRPTYTGIVAWNPKTRELATLFPLRDTSHRLTSKPPTFGAAELCALNEYRNPVWKVSLLG